jgi:hypothetical protein
MPVSKTPSERNSLLRDLVDAQVKDKLEAEKKKLIQQGTIKIDKGKPTKPPKPKVIIQKSDKFEEPPKIKPLSEDFEYTDEQIEEMYPVEFPNGQKIDLEYKSVNSYSKLYEISPERIHMSGIVQSWLNKGDFSDHYDVLFELMMLKLNFFRLTQVLNKATPGSFAWQSAMKDFAPLERMISDKERQMGAAMGQIKEEQDDRTSVMDKVTEMIAQAEDYFVNNMTKVEICPECNALLLGVPIWAVKLFPFAPHATDLPWSKVVWDLVVVDKKLTIFEGASILEISPIGFIQEAKRRDLGRKDIEWLERQFAEQSHD